VQGYNVSIKSKLISNFAREALDKDADLIFLLLQIKNDMLTNMVFIA